MFGNKKIVIIDDELYLLKSFEIFIKHYSPSSTIVTKSTIDNSIFDEVKDADIVVIDYYLYSNMETTDIISKIREINKDIFILCCSGLFIISIDRTSISKKGKYVATDIMKNCLNAGCNRVCEKNFEEILDIIDIHFRIREKALI